MRPRVQRRFEPFSDYTIEAYLCDDLPAVDRAEVERAIDASPDLQRYVAERRAERAAFLLLHPRADALDPAPTRRPRWGWLTGFATAAACATALFVGWPTTVEPLPPTSLVRAKGAVAAALVVQRDGRVFAYRDGMLLRAGDRVRLRVESASGGFLTLVGHDREGLTTYYDAISIPGGSYVTPGSLELDETPGGELWYVLVAADRVSAADYEAMLESGRSPTVPVAVLRLRKEAPP